MSNCTIKRSPIRISIITLFYTAGHQLTMLSELASIREYVQNSDRRLNSLTTQKGITINIPVEIPLKSMANYDVMNNWLENQSNLDNLVSLV